jgi:hypothetical protein
MQAHLVGTPRPALSRPAARALAPIAAAWVVALLVMSLAIPARAELVEVGYRDFAYGTSASHPVSAPTGQKPESKLWYTPDKVWWGVLYNKTSGKFEIYQFDRATQSWSTTGTPIDTRKPSASDTLWDVLKRRPKNHLPALHL